MDGCEIRSNHDMKPAMKPFFVDICVGNPQKPGSLRWCEMDFAPSTVVQGNFLGSDLKSARPRVS